MRFGSELCDVADAAAKNMREANPRPKWVHYYSDVYRLMKFRLKLYSLVEIDLRLVGDNDPKQEMSMYPWEGAPPTELHIEAA